MAKTRRLERILEFTEFNLQRMNPDAGGVMPNVDNPQLSVNAFDKHQNALLAASMKLTSIMTSLSNTSAFAQLKSKLLLDDQKLTSIKILRILKSDDVRYDFYIEFSIGDISYYGVLKDVLGPQPKLSTEAFQDRQLVLTREWIVKMRGLIHKVIERWLEAEPGKYKALKDDIFAVNLKTGNLTTINSGVVVDVRTTFDNQIMIKHEDDFYGLQNDSFIYFNYWFQPES